METKSTAKGQIVIPAEVRRRFGIKQGTRIAIHVDDEENTIVLRPITRHFIEGLRGIDRGKGLLQTLAAERKSELSREEKKIGRQKSKVKR